MPQFSVERRNFAWFALAGPGRCRLLSCRLTRGEARQVVERAVLDASECRMDSRGESPPDTQDEETRFAHATAEWLNQMAVAHRMTRLVVYAPPRMLGLLRRSPFYVTNGHLAEAGEDMMAMAADSLADHPLVRDAVRSRHSR